MIEHGLRGGMTQSTYYPTYNEDELTQTNLTTKAKS